MNAKIRTEADLAPIQKAQAKQNGYDDAHTVVVVETISAAFAEAKAEGINEEYLTDGKVIWKKGNMVRIQGGTFLIRVVMGTTMVSVVYVTRQADPDVVANAIRDQSSVEMEMMRRDMDEYYAQEAAADVDTGWTMPNDAECTPIDPIY